MVRTLSALADRVDDPNAIIYEGAIDRIAFPAVQLKKRGRPRKEDKIMATTTTAPETVAKNFDELVGKVLDEKPELPVVAPVDAKGVSFKLKGDGYHMAARKTFDLETLEKKTQYNVYKVQNLTSTAQFENIPDDRLVSLVNLGFQKEALILAKKAIGGVNGKDVNDFVNQFRFLPQFAKLAAPDSAAAPIRAEAKKKQTAEIMAFIKGYEPLYAQLKEAAAKANESPDSGDSGDDEDEE